MYNLIEKDLIRLLKKEKGAINMWKIQEKILNSEVEQVMEGVWDISDIEFFVLLPTELFCSRSIPSDEEIQRHLNELKVFLENNPDFVYAHANQSEFPFLLSKMPTTEVNCIGDGFNYGSNNIIDNCPKRILICAEDD